MKEVSAKELLKMFATYLNVFADFIGTVAKVEKEHPNFPSLLSSEARSLWAEQFPNIVRELNENEFLSLMRIIYSITRVPNPWVLSIEEKMNFSSKLKSFSKEILKIAGET